MPDYHYDYGYDNNGENGGGRKDDNDLASWIPTIIFLFCFPPVGVVLLIMKLMGVGGNRRRGGAGRHPYDIQREGGANYYGQSAPQPQRPKSQPKAKPASARKKPAPAKGKRLPGKGLTVAGGITAALFGMVAVTMFLEAWSSGYLASELANIFVGTGFCGVGLFMMYLGMRKTKKAKRYRKYLALIGRRDSISVATLAQAMGVSVHRACDDLQDMLDDGVFPTGYLDMSTGRLILNSEGIQDPEPAPEAKAAEEPPKGMEREEKVLLEIRQVNDAIADPVMSAKIDRIGEITGKIFGYLRDKPDKEGQLRSFLSYYLPTTLKILRAYAQMEAQGIEGENISAAKKRIENMMDKVVDGFENQLDKLFQDDAMDITTDVEVLERMLDKDGLGGNQGMTLGG